MLCYKVFNHLEQTCTMCVSGFESQGEKSSRRSENAIGKKMVVMLLLNVPAWASFPSRGSNPSIISRRPEGRADPEEPIQRSIRLPHPQKEKPANMENAKLLTSRDPFAMCCPYPRSHNTNSDTPSSVIATSTHFIASLLLSLFSNRSESLLTARLE